MNSLMNAIEILRQRRDDMINNQMAAVPSNYYLSARHLVKHCNYDYAELKTAAENGILTRKDGARFVYYKSNNLPLF